MLNVAEIESTKSTTSEVFFSKLFGGIYPQFLCNLTRRQKENRLRLNQSINQSTFISDISGKHSILGRDK